jgi:CRP-like cAMP-binding protein
MPPPSLQALLAEREADAFAPGTTLIAPDAAPSHVWFLRSGLVRIYSLDTDGGEFNHDFIGAGDWAIGRIVWKPPQICCSDRAIGVAALQQTEAVRVDVADFDRWKGEHPEIGAYLLDTLMRLTADRYGREADLAQRSAEQRYRDLVAKQPGLLETVPLREIAAWLAITPVALSRIRRRLRDAAP